MIGVDPNTDVAVLKIDVQEELPVLPFADSDRVKVGQFAIAIGNPFQLNYTVTTGIVSGKERSVLPGFTMHYQDFIQTDAWINRGNSGGPLLNIRMGKSSVSTLRFDARTIPRQQQQSEPVPALLFRSTL